MDYKKELEELILNVIRENGSDLHLGAGRVPAIRVTGELIFLAKRPPLTQEDALGFLAEVLEKKKIERLIERFLSLPPSVQIITISYPLSEYHSAFRVQKELSVAFPWGRATAYLQQVRKR